MTQIRSALVTGPTGAVGLALCRRLAAEGTAVYAVVRPGSPRAAALAGIPGVKTVCCDLSDLARLPELTRGAEAFFHLGWAGTAGPARNDAALQEKNADCTLAAARAAAALGARVFVGAGSQAEYGRSDTPLTPETPCRPETAYGKAKLRAGLESRALCRSLGLRHVWARILSVYGPGDGDRAMIPQVIGALLRGEEPALTPGEQIWDYLYADDAARALVLMAERGRDGAVYPLGGGDARPLREYVEMLRDAVDPALPLGFGRLPYGPGQVMHLEADLTALTRDTGFTPETDFFWGIRRTVAHLRGQQAPACVIFDLDGTILDTSPGITESVAYAAEKLGYPPLGRTALLSFIGPPLPESFMRVYACGRERAEALTAAYREHYRAGAMFRAEPYPGIRELALRLRRAGVQTAVATSKPQEFSRALLEHFGLAELFPILCGADMAGHLTKADLIRRCMRRAGTPRCLMIGDTSNDARGALEAAVPFLAAEYGFCDRPALDAWPRIGGVSAPLAALDYILKEGEACPHG